MSRPRWLVALALLLALSLSAAVRHDALQHRNPRESVSVVPSFDDQDSEIDDANDEPISFLDTSATLSYSRRKLRSSPCAACRHIIETISAQAIRLKLSKEDLVVNTQSLCQQLGLEQVLKMQCNAYDEVTEFLSHGHFLSRKANYTKFFLKPQLFCASPGVKLCKANKTYAQDFSADEQAGRLGGVLIRVRLRQPYVGYQRPSNQWTNFVQDFLGDISQALGITPERLELHMHPDDEATDILIKRSDLGPIMGQKSQSPAQLARRLRHMITKGSTALNVPRRLVSTIDTDAQILIIPLVNFKPLTAPSKPKQNDTEPTCPELLVSTKKACGESFKCGTACKSSFSQYFGQCLSPNLTQAEYDKISSDFKNFFFTCDNCDENREVSVAQKCNMNDIKKDYPSNCSLTCSRFFLPYYTDCLAYSQKDVSDSDRVRLQLFYAQCSRCTADREASVKTICDTRNNPNTPYPPVCTKACSTLFMSYYDQCLSADTSLTKEATDFRENCRVSADGGLGLRVKLRTDISNIENSAQFKVDFVENIAKLLHVHPDRMEVTLITPLKVHASKLTTESGAILVDFFVRNPNNYTHASPRALLSNLWAHVNSPASALYAIPQLSVIDSSFGIKTLIAGSHDVDVSRTATAVTVAKSELKKAVGNQELPAIINLLRSIVRLRELGAAGNASQLFEYKAQKRETDYLAAIVRKEPEALIRSLAAYVEYAQSVAAGLPSAKQLVLLAKARYMSDVAQGASPEEKQREHSILRWRQALEYGVPVPTLNTLESIAQYFKDLAGKKPKEQLDLDKARINLNKMIEKGADSANITFGASVVSYMKAIAERNPVDTLKAREANVEYMQAVAFHKPQWLLAEKQAILNYQSAIENQADRVTLMALARALALKHDLADFARNKLKAEEDARRAREQAEREYQAKLKLDKEHADMARAAAKAAMDQAANEQAFKNSQPKMLN